MHAYIQRRGRSQCVDYASITKPPGIDNIHTYIYICTYTHTLIYIYTHTSTQIHTYIQHTYIHTYIHRDADARSVSTMHQLQSQQAQMREMSAALGMYVCTYVCVHACVYVYRPFINYKATRHICAK